MSGLLKKRGREEMAEEVGGHMEAKRFHGGAEQILHLLEDVENDSEERNEQQGCAPSEELLNGVMRSLEEEIGVSCSSSYERSDSLSRDGSMVSDMTSGCGAEVVDIDYLLGASDDELGILPSPVLELDENEGAPTSLELENPELKGLSSGNWHFEDDLVDYRQFAVMEEAAAAAAGGLDVASLGAFMDGDYSAVWRLEAAGGMY